MPEVGIRSASWDDFFLRMADFVSAKSKDSSRKVGCVLVDPISNAVISMGFNGFPRGVDETILERHERPTKYFFSEHAERNSIYLAAHHGVSTRGATAYTQSAPCSDCARALIQAGISVVVCRKNNLFVGSSWEPSIAVGKQMMVEAGIELYEY